MGGVLRRSWRYVLVVVLAWSPLLIVVLGIHPNPARYATIPRPLLRILLIMQTDVAPALLYAGGCLLAWRLADRKKSPLRWAALALAVLQAIALAASVGSHYIPANVLNDVALYSGLALPSALTLLVIGIALEPYVTNPISQRQRLLAASVGFAAVISGLITGSESAPRLVRQALNVPSLVVHLPVQLVWTGLGGLAATAGLPSLAAALASEICVLAIFWYFVARTMIAWAAARSAGGT